MSSMTDIFGDVISSYSRAQGIEDGVLVDVTDTAREAGFRFPVAMTRAAWEDTVAWSEADDKRKPGFTGQDESGRLWDVVYMAAMASRRATPGTDRLTYGIVRVPREGRGMRPKPVHLTLVIGPGDTAAPVFTIMGANES